MTVMVENIVLNKSQMKKEEQKTEVYQKLEDRHSKITKSGDFRYFYLLNSGWAGSRKLEFTLNGEDAKLNIFIILIGSKRDKFDFGVTIRHLKRSCKSRLTIKTVLFEEASATFKGDLIIEKKAQLSDSYLAHKTYLLSDKAKSITTPALEIKADDVKAGHAATTGKPDQEELFYLMSRGINHPDAIKILIESFLKVPLAEAGNDQEVISKIDKFIANSL